MRRPLLALLLVVLGACHGTTRTQAHFCDRLRASAPVLNAPIGSAAAAEVVTKEFESLAAVTPLAIEDDWNALTDVVRTAATMDLADPTAQAALADKVFATNAAAKRVVAYAHDRCEVDLSAAVSTAPATTETTATSSPPPSGR